MQLSPKWKLSSTFVFGTGNAISLPERFYFIDGTLTQEYSSHKCLPHEAIHRLDIAATYTPQHKKPRKYTDSWVFSIYNVIQPSKSIFLLF